MLAAVLILQPAPNVIYTLSLHDALPIFGLQPPPPAQLQPQPARDEPGVVAVEHPVRAHEADRKSTRLNSSHVEISYAVFCLKKKTDTSGCGECACWRGSPLRQSLFPDRG